VLNLAFNAFGSNNYVAAGKPGSFALAGALFTNGTTVTKEPPGIAINNIRVPNTAAAVRPASAVKRGAAARPSASTNAKS